ncbi:MAG: thioredoxin domain-containing protein [Duodenibacillus sp.]|nr:thioredoxin domain-containing protein [Duodenibacillus sp.]
MISRRELILASAAASLPSVSALAAANEFIEGKDFSIVRPAVDYPRRPVVVHLFFAYTCPHCLRFEPEIQEFVKSWSSMREVRIVPVPVAWSEIYDIFPKVYYSLEQLNLLDKFHMPFWEWVIKDPHDNWTDAGSAQKDIVSWFAKGGVPQADLKRTLSSFSVANKVRQAAQTWRHYGVDATPNIGIAGKYLTAPHMAGSRKKAIRCAEYLIKNELSS